MDLKTEPLTNQNLTDDSFTELVKRHQQELQSFLYRFTASKEDAEDIAQETFIKAFKKSGSFKGDSSLRTWLFAIATNLAKDHLRAKQRWTTTTQDKCKELIGSTPALADKLHSLNQSSPQGKYEIREHIDFCFTCIMKTIPIG